MPKRKPLPKLVVVYDALERAEHFRSLAAESRRQAGLAHTDALRAAFLALGDAYDDFAAALETHRTR